MIVASVFRILSTKARPKSKLNEVICERIGSGLHGSEGAWIYPGKFAVKIKGINKPGGANARMMRVEGFPNDFILAIAKRMCGAMELQFRNGWFF